MQRISVEYLVDPDEGHWSIYFSGVHCGHYPSKDSALATAIRDARRVRERGNAVTVRVREADGSVTTLPEAALRDEAGWGTGMGSAKQRMPAVSSQERRPW